MMTSTLSLGRRILAMMAPQAASSIDIILDSDPVLLLGATTAASPALLRGRVILNLVEPTMLQEISVMFRGRACVPSISESLGDADPDSYYVCCESWLVFKTTSSAETLQAGIYTYPFRTFVGGSLPASTIENSPRGIYVTYTLRASAVRVNQWQSLRCSAIVPVLRFLPCDSLTFHQSLDHEATIHGQLSYSLSLPHKAWAAGDVLTATFKASIHTKGVYIRAVKTCITQTRRMLQHGGWVQRIEEVTSRSHIVHCATEGGRASQSSHASQVPKSAPHFASEEDDTEGPLVNPTFSSFLPHSDCNISRPLCLTIPSSTSPSHSIAPIFIDHYVEYTITVVNARGKGRDYHCRLPLHILDHRLLAEAVSATLATRLQALHGSSSSSATLTEVHTPPSYQAHIQDSVPDVSVLPEDIGMRGSSTPSYDDAAKGFQGLPPLDLLRQLPSYTEE